MKVTATRPVWLETTEGRKLVAKGQSADVDGRKYGDSHPFIVEGYLVVEKAPEKPKRKAKPEAVVEAEPEAEEKATDDE